METKFKIFEEVAAAIPLKKGDCALIASDITRLCEQLTKNETLKGLSYLIDLLQEKVGREGTLLFPTYNWGFCKGIPFDYNKTRSKTGALSQAALIRNDFIRTKHPIYSFAVWGKDATKLFAMNDSNSFMGDTPFRYLHENDGLMVMLDVMPLHSFTFVHYVEECCDVDYRFRKEFPSTYIDEEGNETQRVYTMFVRYLDERSVETNPIMNTWLAEQNVLKENTVRTIPVKFLRFTKAYKLIENDIEKDNAKHIMFRDKV